MPVIVVLLVEALVVLVKVVVTCGCSRINLSYGIPLL